MYRGFTQSFIKVTLRCLSLLIYDSIADLGEIEVYLGSKFQSCFIDDFGMSGSLLQYWKYVKQI